MGDVIHTLPALTDAVARLPNIQFDWVVEEAFAEIPQWHSAVSEVIPVAIRRWRKSIFCRSHWQQLQHSLSQIRKRQYDYVIDAQGLIKSAVLTRLARGQRCGMDYSSCREAFATIAYQQQYEINTSLHAIERNRQLFARVLNYTVPTTELDYNTRSLAWGSDVCRNAYLVFVHSASRPEKLWSNQNWVDLALSTNNHGYQVRLVWGNEMERLRSEMIAAKVDNCQVMPQMNLLSIAQLFQGARAVVAVDTGLAHLAAAIGVPALTLYFQTLPQLVGTRGQRQQTMTITSEDSIEHVGSATITAHQVWVKLRCLLRNNLESLQD
ncbi:MAG: lipopolysaccharide heptosyltransferase I [Methylococcales bacterium]